MIKIKEESSPILSTCENSHTNPSSIWAHPYMVYIILTLVLFILLVGIAGLAWTNDWIPHR